MARKNFRSQKPDKMRTVKLFYDTGGDECEGEFVEIEGSLAVNVGPTHETATSWEYRNPNEIGQWDDMPRRTGTKISSQHRCLFGLTN